MYMSKACSYGVRATLYLSGQKSIDYVPVRAVAERLGASSHFLTKILQQLTAAGFVESFRGPRGGVRLAEHTRKATLYDIVVAIDGPGTFEGCVLGMEGCGDEEPCPLHEHWARVRGSIKSVFQSATLGEIGADLEGKGTRLTDMLRRKDMI
jgi:Rrf2 family iron-sulfur cluster assembly transcriptional regulator